MPALGLRGGDVPASSRVRVDAEAPFWRIDVFGWGAGSKAEAEARADKKRKKAKEMEDAAARDALRKAREDRLERELAESGMGDGDSESDGGSILLSMAEGGLTVSL